MVDELRENLTRIGDVFCPQVLYLQKSTQKSLFFEIIAIMTSSLFFFWQGSGLNKLLGYKNQQIYVIRYHSEYMQLNWLFVRLLSARWISSIKAVYCILKAKGLEFANEKKKCGQIEPLHIEINDKLTAAQKPTPTPLSHHIRPMTSPSGSL